MPVMTKDSTSLVRAALFGPPKLRKTWWALRAAELGYNVVMCDFDHGVQIAHKLEDGALSRIFNIDMRVSEDGTSNNSPFAALALALKNNIVFLSEEERKRTISKRLDPDTQYTMMDFSKLSKKDVLIVDSWTVVSAQIKEFLANNSDPLQVPDYNLEQSEYNKMRMLADRMLANLQKLPCHVIIVGHSQEYAKRKADAGAKDKPEDAIESISTTIVSVTKAHGATMPAAMSDVLYFDMPNAMQGVFVSAKASAEVVAGSRTLPPKRAKWEELGIELLLPALDPSEISATFDSEGVQSLSGAEALAEIAAKPAGAAVLNATKTPTLKLGIKP